jgi:hypothetical protein
MSKLKLPAFGLALSAAFALHVGAQQGRADSSKLAPAIRIESRVDTVAMGPQMRGDTLWWIAPRGAMSPVNGRVYGLDTLIVLFAADTVYLLNGSTRIPASSSLAPHFRELRHILLTDPDFAGHAH